VCIKQHNNNNREKKEEKKNTKKISPNFFTHWFGVMLFLLFFFSTSRSHTQLHYSSVTQRHLSKFVHTFLDGEKGKIIKKVYFQ